MKYRILKPENLTAEVLLPASKSISNRALILMALSGGDIGLLSNVSDCDDTTAVLRALAVIARERGGAQPPATPTIDIGAAGTAMRFLTALLAITPGRHLLTGTRRMQERPIGRLVDALRQLGADISYAGSEGYPPLAITGSTLAGGTLRMAGNVSSQYVSALLMIAPLLSGGLRLELEGQVMSRPYIEMTLTMMRDFGARAYWTDDHSLTVEPLRYSPTPYTIESDWSAASYWYAIVFLAEQQQETATLKGLFAESVQGDSAVADIFRTLSVRTLHVCRGQTEPRAMLIRRGDAPRRLEWDFASTPDLAQTVVVACAMRDIAFRFEGLQSLRIKETDRIAALQAELDKLGVSIDVEADGVLVWPGSASQRPASVPYLQPAAGTAIATYDDHRMAMAFAPAAMVLGSVVIDSPEVVTKSYPRFWDDLRQVGFVIETLE